jgi:hypothetical protein
MKARKLFQGHVRDANVLFYRIKTPGLAHLASINADDGRAAIVDPRRDIVSMPRGVVSLRHDCGGGSLVRPLVT